MTGDETWVSCFDPESKRRNSQWTAKDEPHPKAFLRSRSVKKVMLTVFFDSSGMIMAEFLDGGTITSDTYIDILMCLRDSIRGHRPMLWTHHNWILLDDNTSVHTSYDTMTFHRQVRTECRPHPAYSPDLAPSDFYLFPKLKSILRGRCFRNKEELKTAVLQALDTFTKEDFQSCFQQLCRHWAKCVACGGQYFEGDRVEI